MGILKWLQNPKVYIFVQSVALSPQNGLENVQIVGSGTV